VRHRWLTYWSRHGGEDPYSFLQIYAFINVTAIFAIFARQLFIFLAGLRAAKLLFVELLDVILRAPMSFFDSKYMKFVTFCIISLYLLHALAHTTRCYKMVATPIGRIVNRFSKDVYILDEKLVLALRGFLNALSRVISTIFVIS